MSPPEIVFVVVLLLGRFRAHARDISLHKGRLAEVLQRFNHHRRSDASVHFLQLAADARAGHHGGRTFTTACETLEWHNFHGIQPHALRRHENISSRQIRAPKSRLISHVWLFQLARFGAVLLVFARN